MGQSFVVRTVPQRGPERLYASLNDLLRGVAGDAGRPHGVEDRPRRDFAPCCDGERRHFCCGGPGLIQVCLRRLAWDQDVVCRGYGYAAADVGEARRIDDDQLVRRAQAADQVSEPVLVLLGMVTKGLPS